MSAIKFTATKLIATGKQGILKPDDQGYYTLNIGGLNCFNSAGQYYTLEGAKQLFESSSTFMRRVQNGCLKAELGHPKRDPKMSMDDFMNRILTINEANVCAHFKEVWLDEAYGKSRSDLKNPNLVAIMAKVKPAGPQAQALEMALNNPNENVCFSIRALTKDYYERGTCYRVLNTIMTFDYVTEPGIAIANKWDSASLECHSEVIASQSVLQNIVSKPSLIATESTQLAHECLRVMNEVKKKVPEPSYRKW